MNQRIRPVLSVIGFFVVLGIAMSDRFDDFRTAVPESVYYYVFVTVLAGMTVLGFYAWWQHYNGRQLHPTVDRFKKWFESGTWWNWPF